MFYDPLFREPGEALDSLRHDEKLLSIKEVSNRRIWAALWMQNPRIAKGDLINSGWFKIISESQLPEQHKRLGQARAWDLAYSKKQVAKKEPDFSVGISGFIDVDYDVYVTDLIRIRDIWPVVKRKIFSVAEDDGRAIPLIIESGGAQKGLFDELKHSKELKGFKLRDVSPSTDKVARAQPWIDYAENNSIYLVNANWNNDFLDECEAFDRGRHDDQVDAMSLLWLRLYKFIRRTKLQQVKVSGLY
jgi:predicted phage terminase large subunit-like protein